MAQEHASGRDDGYTRLVEEHHGALYRFALCLTGEERSAIRLTGAAFKRWKRNRHHWCEDTKARLLLFASCYHEYAGCDLSESDETRPVGTDTGKPGGAVSAAGPVPAALRDLPRLIQAFKAVSEPRRIPLAMHYSGGFGPKQIARILDRPVPAVAELLLEGRVELCAALQREPERRSRRAAQWNVSNSGGLVTRDSASPRGKSIRAVSLWSACFHFLCSGRAASKCLSASDS